MGSKGSYGDFNIKAIDLVKMMAIAQARLGRRIGNEGIQEEGFPQYSSPFNSPKNKNNNQGIFQCFQCFQRKYRYTHTRNNSGYK